MRLTYFKYHLQDSSKQKSHFDLNRLFTTFAKFDDMTFKNSFTDNGEFIYLLKLPNNIYMLVKTKDKEIIKSINTKNISATDLKEKVDKNSKIGFASYIYVEKFYVGVASTMWGPKMPMISRFVDDLLEKLQLPYRFEAQPFPLSISYKDSLKLDYTSKITLELYRNKLAKTITDTLGFDNEYDSLEINIKPAKNKNTNEGVKGVSKKLEGSSDIKKYIIRGKQEFGDHLSDLYIVGSGHISDEINTKVEAEIQSQIIDKVKANGLLKENAKSLKEDKQYENFSHKHLNSCDEWGDIISPAILDPASS